ncbi:TCTP family protein [Trichophyton verrucosum HKI 0517]|uniref:Translationally-controlled tumor protein homolog n=1 Tax=Trichophyton verrucosum (strain HKI 0517) TaxID=663202 RepID=D4DL85_TRIVH|nr:TCTP family protein [Trichophyton verrucosum HKI 0517]EFE37390.1 TCTP family protein [Trichophyton verrucosum HKI 0517]
MIIWLFCFPSKNLPFFFFYCFSLLPIAGIFIFLLFFFFLFSLQLQRHRRLQRLLRFQLLCAGNSSTFFNQPTAVFSAIMIIFKDIITDDELISDAYKMQDKGVIYEVDAKRVTKGADNIQLEGANPSAEEADEGTEDTSTTVIDVADSFRLSPVEFDKKAYTSAVKSTFSLPRTK